MENTKSKFTRGLEIATNLSIIAVALIGAAVLVKNYLLTPKVVVASDSKAVALERGLSRPPDQRPAPTGPAVGTQLSVPGINWNESEETVVLALSNKCHFCSESAPFYQKLANDAAGQKKVRVVAVFPQDVGEGKKYLDGLNVPITQIAQASLDSVGVRGTPTLMILDKTGVVKQSWVGRLTPEKESEVLSRIKT